MSRELLCTLYLNHSDGQQIQKKFRIRPGSQKFGSKSLDTFRYRIKKNYLYVLYIPQWFTIRGWLMLSLAEHWAQHNEPDTMVADLMDGHRHVRLS